MTTLKDLIAQKEALEREISQKQNQDRAEAVAKVRALMDEYSLTAADVSSRGAAKPRASKAAKPTGKVAAKYRDNDTGDTWSGRGLQPKWLRAAIHSGRKIGDFAI